MTNAKAHTKSATKQLGNSDLNITAIGFGAWAIGGGDWQFAWGHQEDDESIEAIVRSVELGLNWIDTAAIYGLGHSEEVVAKAIKKLSGNGTPEPYIFTKCSMRWNDKREIYRSLTASSVREEVENSLRRLDVDVIDLYQIHWPDPLDEIEAGWEEMVKLQQEGKLRWLGVSNFNVEQMKRVQKIAPITSLQPPYSLLNRKVQDEILPFCQQNNIGVINYSPMSSGLLTGKMTAERIKAMPQDDWRRKSPNFLEPKLTRNLELVELLRGIAQKHDVEPGVVAIAWTLRNPAVTAAIVGGRNAKQVEGTSAAAEFRLSTDEVQQIDAFVAENLQ